MSRAYESTVGNEAVRSPADHDLEDGVEAADQEKARAVSESQVRRHLAGLHREEIAERGFSGERLPFPRRQAIEDRAGVDLGDVETHVGGVASDAAGDLGAEAYARGNQVAFSSPPDLGTAAHEAAHVLQQSDAVHAKSATRAGGDELEADADSFAEQVTRGEVPVTSLPKRGASQHAVQRKAKVDTSFSKRDDRKLVTLLLRASAAEAKKAVSEVEAAQNHGTKADADLAFEAGCSRTRDMLEEAYAASDTSTNSDADLKKLFAPSDLAFGWIGALLRLEPSTPSGTSRGAASLRDSSKAWRKLLEIYGWKPAATAKALRHRGERHGQKAHLHQSERGQAVKLTLDLARHEVTFRMGQLGADKTANKALVNEAAFACLGRLEFAESCLRQPSEISPDGTGDPTKTLVPEPTKAGLKFKDDIAVTVQVLQSLFAAGRKAGDTSNLEDVYKAAIRLSLQCGISAGNHPAYQPGNNDPTPVEFESWGVADLCDHQLKQVEAGLTNLDGALGVWQGFLDTPSSNEAKERPLAELAAEAARDQLFDLMLSPLEGLPGAGIITGFYKMGWETAKKKAEDAARAKRDKESIYARDFVVNLRENLTKQKANLESNWVTYRKSQQSFHDALANEGSKIEFRSRLRAKAESMRASLSGPTSIAGFFSAISGAWVRESSEPGSGDAGHLELDLDGNWQVEKAFLHAPRGSRIAEGLLREDQGNINLKALQVPIRVHWYPSKNRDDLDGISDKKFATALIASDGTLIHALPHTLPKNYGQLLRDQLASNGIPQITNLNGTKAA